MKRSTSFAEPMQSAVRWSTAVISTSKILPPVTPSLVLPPAFSTSSPNGAASKARRSFAGDESEVGDVPTAVAAADVQRLGDRIATTPNGFAVHRKIRRQLDALGPMYAGETPLTWAAAELLAYASLR